MIKKVIESIFGSLEKDVEKVMEIEKSIKDNKEKAIELSQEFNPIIKKLERDFNIMSHYCNIKKGEERDEGLMTLNRTNDKLKKAKSEYFKELSELRKSNTKLSDKLQDLLSKDQVKELVEKAKKKDSIDKIIKSLNNGILDYDKLEKAHKYIRREGSPGNYKYIYSESNNSINFKKELDYAKRIIKGEYDLKRLSPTEEQGRLLGGQRNVEASIILRRNEKTGSKSEVLDTKQDQERRLKEYAKDQKIWVDDYKKTNWGKNYLDEGGEAEVYRFDDNSVYKVHHYPFEHEPLKFFDRIALHNVFSPEVPYELIGFTEKDVYGDKQFAAIIKQPFINIGDSEKLSVEDVDKEMIERGFEEVDGMYINKDLVVGDLHPGNILKTPEGNVVFIDPLIEANTQEAGYGGERVLGDIIIPNNITKSIVTIINAYLDDKVKEGVLEKATKGQDKVAKVMREFKAGELKDSHGNKVTERDQALAIAMSEAGLSKSEDKEEEKSETRPQTDTKEFLEEMIKEHERLIGILKPHAEMDEKVKKELSIQVKELAGYKEELEDLKKKGDNEDEKIQKSIEKIEDLFNKGVIPEDILIKARSGKYADNPVNRRLNRVGQPYGSKKQEDESKQPKTGKKEDEKRDSKPQDLEEQAKQTSGSALEQAAKEANDPEVRSAAHKELDRREKEEKVQGEDGESREKPTKTDEEKDNGGKNQQEESQKDEENVTSKNKEEDNQLRKNLLKYYFGSEYGDIRAKTVPSMKYKNLGDITLRISDHSASAKNQSLNEVSIVTFRDDATEDKFISATNTNVGGKSLEDSISIINNELKKELKKYTDDIKVNDANDLDDFFKTVQEVSNEVGMDNNEVSKLIKNKLDGLDIEDTNVFGVEDLLDSYSDLYDGSININVKKRDSDSDKVDENADDNKERQLNKIKSRLKKEGISENEEKLAKDIFMNSSPKVGEPIKSEMVLNILASNIYKEKDKK